MSGIRDSLSKLAEPIGFDYGADASDTQAAMLNGFARGMLATMPDAMTRRRQLAYVVDEMNPKAIDLFIELAGMAQASRDARP